MASHLRRRADVAGLLLILGLIAAALPGAVAGSWLTPVDSEPLATVTSTVPIAASRVVVPRVGVSWRGGQAVGAAATTVGAATRPAGSGPAGSRPTGSRQATGWISRSDVAVPTARSKSVSPSQASSGTYAGRNHVWIPALGINRSVGFFSCTSSAYPGNVVYRWGCAGSNNIYLFGHAHSVFKPLHDAYVRGALQKGMQVIYADGAGTVSTYAVSWWKVTTPDKGEFAYAAQGMPSLTLQTCVGAQSQYRLIVRLTKVG